MREWRCSCGDCCPTHAYLKGKDKLASSRGALQGRQVGLATMRKGCNVHNGTFLHACGGLIQGGCLEPGQPAAHEVEQDVQADDKEQRHERPRIGHVGWWQWPVSKRNVIMTEC